ncbi:hypothetical protein ACJMK2_043041, partial [Sinanodonta woodiana]
LSILLHRVPVCAMCSVQSQVSTLGVFQFARVQMFQVAMTTFSIDDFLQNTRGHLNPAVTLALSCLGRFPWKKVPVYMLAQYLGSFVASALVYFVYYGALNNFDGGNRLVEGEKATAGIWSTYPQSYVSTYNALGDQKSNNTYFCGSRYRGYNWFWVPIVGPLLGAVLGAFLYQLCIGFHWPIEDTRETKYHYNGPLNADEEKPGIVCRTVNDQPIQVEPNVKL